MARKKQRKGPVPYSWAREAGPGWRLQILDPETGAKLSPRKIIDSEPAFYETEDDVRAAYVRLHDRLKLRLERGATLRGFWEDWTDPDHWQWGTDASGRKVQSLSTLKSHARGFVNFFGDDKRIDTIAHKDVEAWLKTKPASSGIPVVNQMFEAAIMAKLIASNPLAEPAKTARKTAHAKRERREKLGDNNAPEPGQIAELLDDLGNEARYPFGLYAWFAIGTAVGLRSGELDGMWRDDLDLSDPSRPLYHVRRQYHTQLDQLTEPKYDSVREILLPQFLVPTLERLVWESRRLGSPFLLRTTRGQNWRNHARAYYWNDDKQRVSRTGRKRGTDRTGLRRIVGDVSMYCATRAYFATQAVLAQPHEIPKIARHYGHKDNGKVLLQFYTRLTDTHGQDGMANVYAALHPYEPVRLADRRRAA